MLNATITNADQYRYLYTVQPGRLYIIFLLAIIENDFCIWKSPFEICGLSGTVFLGKKKMLLMSFECKSLALSTTNEIPFIFFVFRWQLQSQRHISKKLGGKKLSLYVWISSFELTIQHPPTGPWTPSHQRPLCETSCLSSTVILSLLTGFRAQLYICTGRAGTGAPPPLQRLYTSKHFSRGVSHGSVGLNGDALTG